MLADPQPGRIVQADPIKPTWKAPGTERLKLNYDQLVSNFAFKFNVRRYNLGGNNLGIRGRDSHSSTSRLNVSTFCGKRCVCGRGQRQETAQVELKIGRV